MQIVAKYAHTEHLVAITLCREKGYGWGPKAPTPTF